MVSTLVTGVAALHIESGLAKGDTLAVFSTPKGDLKFVGVFGTDSNLALVSASSRFFCRVVLANKFA